MLLLLYAHDKLKELGNPPSPALAFNLDSSETKDNSKFSQDVNAGHERYVLHLVGSGLHQMGRRGIVVNPWASHYMAHQRLRRGGRRECKRERKRARERRQLKASMVGSECS